MPSPLVKPLVRSIYEVAGQRILMPERMAKVTPDLKRALYGIRDELKQHDGKLELSDLFRSYDMQLQAHLDYTSGKKKAFSPPPGGSMHESGRAFDVDLSRLKVPLAEFWQIAARWGVVPIIAEPKASISESWHFECRGSHQKVYEHYRAERGTNFKPATAMAISAIIGSGVPHDRFKGKQDAAYVQSALIRLGHDLGNIDGDVGPKTLKVLESLQVDPAAPAAWVDKVDALLQQKYPEEFFDKAEDDLSAFV
ncbi:M15 family metallopeptidase [Ideonella sp. DXS22W]|uniref:M15 family metallopeptidase n=1 Tax=Pseudaquabacterium inlustre TaxID=2984192 RepID=A0ABU9CKR1_9BURK